MESLEAELAKVERLRIDLSAEIVIQEEKGHYDDDPRLGEEVYQGGYYGGSSPWGSLPGEKLSSWVVDKPRIAEPDTKKREIARVGLQQIYDSSEWYSGRYVAGRALGVSREQLNQQINLGLSEVSRRINATKIGGGKELCAVETYVDGNLSKRGIGYAEIPHDVPDKDKRINAIKDIVKIYPRFYYSDAVRRLLIEAYKNNEVREVRTQAGKALGYSSLRIWLHELFGKK